MGFLYFIGFAFYRSTRNGPRQEDRRQGCEEGLPGQEGRQEGVPRQEGGEEGRPGQEEDRREEGRRQEDLDQEDRQEGRRQEGHQEGFHQEDLQEVKSVATRRVDLRVSQPPCTCATPRDVRQPATAFVQT